VRFAAARAIMAIDPRSPYPGSSRLPDVLAHFAAGNGTREALVAMPNLTDATDVAGKLNSAGAHPDVVDRGNDVARLGAQLSDLEIVLIDMDIDTLSNVRQALYELRITPETARVPVALLAADGRLADAQRLASEHDRVIAVSRPHTRDAVARIANRLVEIGARGAVPADERVAQAEHARAWFVQLQERGPDFYVLRRPAPAATLPNP
jgi:hypothetical protein